MVDYISILNDWRQVQGRYLIRTWDQDLILNNTKCFIKSEFEYNGIIVNQVDELLNLNLLC